MEQLKAQYAELFGKEVPVNKKNDQDWIQGKIDSFVPEESEFKPNEALLEKVEKEIDRLVDSQSAMVFIKGEPFAVIGNEYVPQAEVEEILYKTIQYYINTKI